MPLIPSAAKHKVREPIVREYIPGGVHQGPSMVGSSAALRPDPAKGLIAAAAGKKKETCKYCGLERGSRAGCKGPNYGSGILLYGCLDLFSNGIERLFP